MTKYFLPYPLPLRTPYSPFRNFNYIHPIRIEGSTEDLRDYQVKIVLNSNNFPLEKCKSDGSDIRFRDETGQALPHWIESWTSNEAVIWCRIPYIPARKCKNIWLIYGNSAAVSASDGDSTFEFFDDFDSVGTGAVKYKLIATNGLLHPDGLAKAFGGNQNPSAVYVPSQDKTYIVYAASDDHPRILYYDHTSNSFSEIVNIGGSALDYHGIPVIAVDSDGYIHVFYGHYPLYYKKSTNPYDITSWGSERVIADEGVYQNAYFHGGTLYLLFLYRYVVGSDYQLVFKKSTDGGSSWSSLTKLTDFNLGGSEDILYGKYIIDSNGVIHAAWSWYKTSLNKRVNIYYMKSEDGGSTWKKADGTVLSIPVDESTAEKVYDSGTDFCDASSGDLQADSNSRPLILFSSNKIYKLARWNGASWDINDIVSVDHDFDAGALILDSDSQYRAYITIGSGRGGELKEYLSTDSGNTWNYVQVISGGTVTQPKHVHKQSSDKRLELLFCGGDAGNNAVSAGGKNASFTSESGLNEEKWNYAGNIEVLNSEALLDEDDAIYSKYSWGYGYSVIAYAKADEQDVEFISFRSSTAVNPSNEIGITNSDAVSPDDYDEFNCRTIANGDGNDHIVDNQLDFRNIYRKYEITRLTGESKYYQDDNLMYTRTSHLPTANLGVGAVVWDSSQTSTLILDWILVRKYHVPEPVVII